MPHLTRRCADNQHCETWHIYYGDVHVGTIGRRAGVPIHVDQWSWACGFYPGIEPGQHQDGTAADFDQARAGFERAWSELLPTLTPTAIDDYRRSRAFHRWKETMWEAGRPLPTQLASNRSTCFCGVEIDVRSSSDHIYSVHMEMR